MMKYLLFIPFIASCAHFGGPKKIVCVNLVDASKNSKVNYNHNNMQICRVPGSDYTLYKSIREDCTSWVDNGKVQFKCKVRKDTTMRMSED